MWPEHVTFPFFKFSYLCIEDIPCSRVIPLEDKKYRFVVNIFIDDIIDQSESFIEYVVRLRR